MPKPFDGQEIEGTHGFIMPNGEFIALEDVDRMCAHIGSVYDSAEKLQDLIEALAMECVGHGMHAAACGYFARRLLLLEEAEAKADCLLKMGQTMEQAGDFEKALEHYTRAFDLPEGDDDIWYFLNNNRGYCLNVLGRRSEAQEFCRVAAVSVLITNQNEEGRRPPDFHRINDFQQMLKMFRLVKMSLDS